MKEQSITKGFAILSIASIVAKLLSLIYVPFLTRIVGSVGMGIYGKTYDIFVFVYALTNVGLQTAIIKICFRVRCSWQLQRCLKSI